MVYIREYIHRKNSFENMGNFGNSITTTILDLTIKD